MSISLFAVAIAAARFQDEPATLPATTSFVTQLETGTPYAVAVTGNRTTLDLDFSQGIEYTLIVSSLADAESEHDIRISVESVNSPPCLPGSRIRRREPHREAATDSRLMETRSSGQHEDGFSSSGVTREFHIHVTDGSLDDRRQYAKVVGRLLANGRHVSVYLDAQQSPGELHPGVVREIVRVFDDEIIPTTRRVLGDYRDVDGDGRFTVLLSPWLDRLQGGRVSLGGFVRGADFRDNVKSPFGNRCDMLSLNSNVTPGANLKTLLAHEFAHAVSFSVRLPTAEFPLGLPDEEDWLNEAIAHLSENLHEAGWSNLDHRVRDFLAAPQSFPLVVPDYYSAGLWRNHGCRGATFLFLRWCVDQYGRDILRQLIQNPTVGRANLESVTGRRFAELYRRWTIAVSGDCDDGGYRSISLTGTLGRHEIAGAKKIVWMTSDEAKTIPLRGTSTAFIRLASEPSNGVKRIRIDVPEGTRLQVSVIPTKRETGNDSAPH